MASDTLVTTSSAVACAHCGLPVPSGLVELDAPLQFCCPGCRAVYNTIHACGLDAYYAMRDDAGVVLAQPASPGGKYEGFDDAAFQKLYVSVGADGLASIDLVLEGVTCGACVWLVEKLPGVLPGVIESRLSLREHQVFVRFDPSRVRLSQIAQLLDQLGYRPHPARGVSRRELHRAAQRQALVDIGLSGAVMGNMMLLGAALYAGWTGGMEETYTTLFRWISGILGVFTLLVPGRCFWISSWNAIRNRTVNLDLPITLALLSGLVAGVINIVLNRGEIYFDSLSVLVFLLLVGRYIQSQQQRKADDAVELLFDLTPRTARRIASAGGRQSPAAESAQPMNADARYELPDRDEAAPAAEDRRPPVGDVVPVESLSPGDVVEVWPGELLCADGVIVDGRSSVDQALLTGESEPVPVSTGDRVYGGAMNVGGTLRIRVDLLGADTRVGRLMELVSRGASEKPNVALFADRVGRIFLPAVCLLGAITFAFWYFVRGSTSGAIDHTVAFLIVTCPCVLGLATPLTLAAATGKLARMGILVKSAVALEKLAARRGELLLDKTGTITEGKLKLLEWIGDDSLQPIVAEIERRSTHPVGRALVEATGDRELSAQDRANIHDVVELGDGGVSATWFGRPVRVGSARFMLESGIELPDWAHSASLNRGAANSAYVSVNGHVVAIALLGDRVRADAKDAVASLRSLGWSPTMLSGDHRVAAHRVAREVGIDEANVKSQVTPEEKLDAVKRAAARRAVMIGDGVNDAAALAAADVGIAVQGGAEASLAAADVYIARPGLANVVELFRVSRHTMFVVKRNFCITLSYNILAGVLAMMGVMNPLVAAILMPMSSATTLATAVWSVNRKRSISDRTRSKDGVK
jgi:Cu2+-exporting ATPase